MTQRTLEERVADLERRVAELSAKVTPNRGEGMTGPELVAFMREHASADLQPIFDEAMKLRQKDREKAYRKFDREQARKAAKKPASAARRRAKA
jgi:hypothetical protein